MSQDNIFEPAPGEQKLDLGILRPQATIRLDLRKQLETMFAKWPAWAKGQSDAV
jgi:hypothetical protein